MSELTAKLEKSRHILTLCHMLSNRIGGAFIKELELKNFNVAEWRVLLTIAQNAPTTGIKITSQWAMDKMTVNRSVKSLHKRGLIQKKQNNQDRRTIDLVLTPSGVIAYRDILPIANDRYHKIMENLSKTEEQSLRATLLKIINHIDNAIE